MIFILYFLIAGVQDFLGFKFTDAVLYGTFFVKPSCDPKQLLVPIQQSAIEARMRCRKVFFCKTLIARLLRLPYALNNQYTRLSEKYSIFSARFKLMGWVIVFAIKPLINNLPLEGLLWLVAGGISCTIIVGCLNHLQFFDQYLDCSVTF